MPKGFHRLTPEARIAGTIRDHRHVTTDTTLRAEREDLPAAVRRAWISPLAHAMRSCQRNDAQKGQQACIAQTMPRPGYAHTTRAEARSRSSAARLCTP